MQKTEFQEKRVLEVVDILCNRCGKTCKSGYGYAGLIGAKVTGGYNSLIGDGVSLTFDLCEQCVINLTETFTVAVLPEDDHR